MVMPIDQAMPKSQPGISIVVMSFVGAIILGILTGLVAMFPAQTPTKSTLLEQRATNLSTANVELCGMTATQLSTGFGVFNADPTIMGLLHNPMKAGIHSVIEIAYSANDRSIKLVGGANSSENAHIYYCRH